MPVRENFAVRAGNGLVLQFTIAAEDGISLQGAIVRWWAARSKDTPPAEVNIKKSSENDGEIEITNVADRTFDVTLLESDTVNLFDHYYHEAEVVDAEGNASTVTFGQMTVDGTLIR